MDLRRLRHFQAIVAAGSFKAGAELANISAPALTKSIQLLEAELDTVLFWRRRGRPVLTEAGEMLASRCQHIFQEIQDIKTHIGKLERQEAGTVRLGCGPHVAQTLLGPALIKLSQAHPGIRVIVTTGNSPQLLPLLKRAELDLITADLGSAESNPNYLTEKFMPDPFIWIANVQHPLSRKKNITLKELTGFPLALPRPPEHMVLSLQARYGTEIARAIRSPIVQSDDYALLLELVRYTHYLVAIPDSQFKKTPARDSICQLTVKNFHLNTHAGIIRRRAYSSTSAQAALISAFHTVDRQP